MKTALIIQGPLTSVGRTGKSLTSSRSEFEIREFNCSETVNEYVRRYSKDFDVIILSTWSDQDLTKVGRDRNNFVVVVNNDQTSSLNPEIQEGIVFGNNKLKQMFSLQAGLHAANQRGCSRAVKVRTDNLVDAAELRAQSETDLNKLWFPNYSSIPNFLGDFFFAGSIENLLTLCNAILDERNMYRLIHNDLFYGFTRAKLKDKEFGILDYFPDTPLFSRRQVQLIEYARSNYFAFFKARVWNEQVWRGERIDVSDYIDDNLINAELTRTLSKVKSRYSFFSFSYSNFLYFKLGDRNFLFARNYLRSCRRKLKTIIFQS